MLRGEIGIGRSAVLGVLAERVRATGIAVHEVTCLPRDHHTAYLLAHRLVTALSPPGPLRAVAPEPPVRDSARHPAGRVPPGSHDPGETLALQLTRALRTRARTVVLVDDAQFADPETVGLVRFIAPVLAVSAVRLILGVSPIRSPTADHLAPEHPRWLLPDDLAGDAVCLAPLTEADVTQLITHRLRAVPDHDLVAELYRLSAGNPGALTAALGPAGEEAIGTLIGHAHLRPGAEPPVLHDDDRFVRALRDLGDTTWQVAKALSVLEPMGGRAPDILSAATGLPAAAVVDALTNLTASGLVSGPDRVGDAPARGWSFRIPLVAVALRARLGPYERRAASAAAVRALWEQNDRPTPGARQGPAGSAERRAYLADRIVDAGALVDRHRALSELLVSAAQFAGTQPRRAAAWLRAAADLTDDPLLRATSLARHAATAYRAGDARRAADAAGTVLRTHGAELSPGTRQEITVVLLMSLAAAGDVGALSAYSGPRPANADDTSAIAGVLALCLLGHWSQALDLIATTGLDTRPDPVARRFGELYRDVARLMGGEVSGRCDGPRPVADPSIPAQLAFELTVQQCDWLLALGSLHQATALLRQRGVDLAQLPAESLFLWQYLTGAWEAGLATARTVMVGSHAMARPPVSVLVHAHASTMLLALGRPSRARTVLDHARAQPISMPYLLDAEEADIALFIGEPGLAEEAVRRGLTEARERGHVFGTEPLWAALAALQCDRGYPEHAVACLRELERIARAAPSDRNRLLHLRSCLAAATRHPKLATELPEPRGAAREAVALARSLDQPFETARTLLAVAAFGAHGQPDDEALLREAYETFGELGALVWRYRTRTALRDAGLPVPGRRTATEENERLLATLVTEGLTNRQIARALALSEGSVASRLNRLFHRTGLRSRVELATLMLTEHPR